MIKTSNAGGTPKEDGAARDLVIADMAGMLGISREMILDLLAEGRLSWASDESQTFFRLRDVFRHPRLRNRNLRI